MQNSQTDNKDSVHVYFNQRNHAFRYIDSMHRYSAKYKLDDKKYIISISVSKVQLRIQFRMQIKHKRKKMRM